MGGDWDKHLATMKKFWASVALGAGEYDGRPVPAHFKHKEKIQPEHFTRWLGLFEETLKDVAPTPGAAAFFLDRAERIAQSLRYALFGLPSLSEPKPASLTPN